jgi:hypothetical protein
VRLTIEQDPQSIKRYGHLKPARGLGVRACSARCPGSTRACTLEAGHRGPHVAHGVLGKVLAVWDGAPEPARSDVKVRRAVRSMARRGAHDVKPVGGLGALWTRLVSLNLSVEEMALLVLFVAMVGFVVHWVSLIIW